MRASKIIRLLSVGLLLTLVSVAEAQQDEPPVDETTPQEEAAGLSDSLDLDSLLEGEESELASDDYTYNSGDRRDPFKSLLVTREQPELRGPRPEGIRGLLIDEVDLTGIFVTSEGPVAQVQSSERDRSYLLRVGDRLYDGDVVDISGSQIVFKQLVDDPTALKPFQEVVKKLAP